MSEVTDMATTEVAILLDDFVDKYNPGIQVFKLQSISGLQNNDRTITTEGVSIPNLMNKNKDIGLSKIQTSSVIKLQLPREVTRNFPYKFIPKGTRFTVTFDSGDITKPRIIGREFD